MTALVADLVTELSRRRLPLQGDPKRSMFRINRDTRFSKDKRPYKTHVSAALTWDGGKSSAGVLYVHIDPEGSFAAAGFFRPEPDLLHAIRDSIVTKTDLFRRALAELAAADLVLAQDEDALIRAPRGFESVDAGDLLDLLRCKSFVVRSPLPRKSLTGSGLPVLLADFAEAAMPLLRFGWGAR